MASKARPNKPDKYIQGYYILQNPEKYIGNPNEIIYRSSYERRFCFYCDLNPKILKWGSEVVTIPYKDYLGKKHQYYIDFYVELENKLNMDIHKRLLIEIKPLKETNPPNRPGNYNAKALERYKNELETYYKNLAKWDAAKKYAKKHGMEFIIITEKHLNLIN